MLTTKIGSGIGPLLQLAALGGSSTLRIFSTRRTPDTAPKLLTSVAAVSSFNQSGPRWSNDGRFLVIYHQSTGLVFVERNGLVFTSQAVPSNIATTYGTAGIALDGSYVAFACQATPFLRIYYNDLGTLTNITSIGTTAAGGAVAVSYDGTYVAALRNVSPSFLQIKRRTGSGSTATFSDISIASQPGGGSTTGGVGALAFSPNATFLAVSYSNGRNLYRFNSSTSLYELQANSSISGGTTSINGYGAVFSPDETWLAFSNTSQTQLFVQTSPTVYSFQVTLTGGYAGSFDLSGNYYLAGSGQLYKKSTATSWPLLHTLPTATGAAFAPSIN